MRILVIGGTGTVGSRVVRELVDRGEEVRVLTRDAARARDLPRGAEGVVGDLAEPETVRSVFRGVDGVFLLNPVDPTETHQGLMAVNGIQLAEVERTVYVSVHHVDEAPHLPHFGSKVAVETALRASGTSWTILRPNNFFQNDHWFREPLLEHGVYPQPIGDVGLSRVDVEEIAEAAAVALTTGEHGGRTYDLVGPDVLTGEETAEIWSRVLDRPVRYAGDDLDAWEAQALQMMPAWMVFDFRRMYQFFQESGLRGTEEAVERQTELLGHPPRRFEDFARELAQAWRG